MEDTMKTLGQLAGKTLEAMTILAETNQRVARELVELGAGAAREGLQLSSELSRTALDAVRESQTAALRWQGTWMDAAKDPAAWYQKAMVEGIAGVQQTFRRAEDSAQVLTRAAERFQASAEQAGKSIQESVASAVSRIKDVQTG